MTKTNIVLGVIIIFTAICGAGVTAYSAYYDGKVAGINECQRIIHGDDLSLSNNGD
jgi:hypothetical protein